VFCSNKTNGCAWTDERGSLVAHLEQFCEHCCCENDECQWLGQEKERDDHMEECEYVEVNCPDDCGMAMERRFLADHKEECKVFLELERQRQSKDLLSQCDNLNPCAEDMITMMVGGEIFVASRKMLTRHVESVLGVLFAEKERPLKRNDTGVVYLDTCKTSFAHVLTWLHQGIVCPEAGSAEFRLLKVEAARWRLLQLSDELEELSRRANLKLKKEKAEVKSTQPMREKKAASAPQQEPRLKQEQQAKQAKPEKQERRIKPEQVEGKFKPRVVPDARTPEKLNVRPNKPQIKGDSKGVAKGAKSSIPSPTKKKS
jgi:hypothetical protein